MFKQKVVNQNSRASIKAAILMENYRAGVWKDKGVVIKVIGNREFDVSTIKGIRKMVKYLYLEQFPNHKRTEPKCKINEWLRKSSDGEEKTYVGIFAKTPKTMDAVSQYINLEEDPNYYDYSPTGLWFGDEAEIYELKDRIFVIKTWKLDC